MIWNRLGNAHCGLLNRISELPFTGHEEDTKKLFLLFGHISMKLLTNILNVRARPHSAEFTTPRAKQSNVRARVHIATNARCRRHHHRHHQSIAKTSFSPHTGSCTPSLSVLCCALLCSRVHASGLWLRRRRRRRSRSRARECPQGTSCKRRWSARLKTYNAV